MRAVHLQDLPDWIRDLFDTSLREAGIDAVWAGGEEDEALPKLLAGADVLLTSRRRVGADLLDTPGLSFVQVHGRAPWAVDWRAASEVNVPVSVLPHRGAVAVAEQAIALMLGLYRMVVDGHKGTIDGSYESHGLEPIRTSERKIAFNWLNFDSVRQLHGKQLGLIGLGDIGLEVARRALAFDMDTVYYKSSQLPVEFETIAGVRGVSLDELLSTSDVVSLHVPHTEQTEGMINTAALTTMKPDAILVNTARGGLVDEGALIAALKGGEIAGAGLDAFIDEPLPIGHGLMGCPNLLCSPHVGGGTGGGQRGMIQSVVDNLQRVASGVIPLGLVDGDGSPLGVS